MASPPPTPNGPRSSKSANSEASNRPGRAAARPDAPSTPQADPPGDAAAPDVRKDDPADAAAVAPAGGHPNLRDKRIGVIGAGAMGGALCRGLVHGGASPASRLVVADPHAAHVQKLQQTLGVKVAESNSQLARYSDIVVIAVKPYLVAGVLDEIKDSVKRDDGKPLPLVISIAAGVSVATIQSHVGQGIPVVRAMPNTPAQVGKGACAYCKGSHADAEHMAQAAAIFEAVGIAVEVPEGWLDAVTALSGSGPAYVYLMIEALVDGGVKVGLPRDVAMQLAAQTVLGAAQMVIETGMHPAQLRDMVTTPAGSTIAAITALEHSGLRAALIDAVEKAAARSRELG
jgi:pyrroline-5-carboxylate reductase